MSVVLAVAAALAVYRVTRLLVADKAFEWFRLQVERWFGTDSAPAYLVECFWCASMWLAWPIVAAVVVWPDNRAVQVVVFGLAASAITGQLGAREPTDEGDE